MMTLVRIAGFDPVLVQRLEARHAWGFVAIGLGALIAAVTLGAGSGTFAAWALESTAAGIGCGLFIALLSLAMTRLVHGGSGHPLRAPTEGVATWRPPLGQLLFHLAWAAIFAQPLVARVLANDIEPRLDSARAELVQVHASLAQNAAETQLAALAEDERRTEGPAAAGDVGSLAHRQMLQAERERVAAEWRRFQAVDLPAYRDALAASSLVAHRVLLVWTWPGEALPLTLLFTLLGALAAVLRAVLLAAARAYERLRHEQERAWVAERWAEGSAAIGATLAAAYPESFRGPLFRAFEDPPFDTVPRLPPYLEGERRAGGATALVSLLHADGPAVEVPQ